MNRMTRRGVAMSALGLVLVAAGACGGSGGNQSAQGGVIASSPTTARVETTTTTLPTTTTTAMVPLTPIDKNTAFDVRHGITELQDATKAALASEVGDWQPCFQIATAGIMIYSVETKRMIYLAYPSRYADQADWGDKPPTADPVLREHISAAIPPLEQGARLCSDGHKKIDDGELANDPATMSQGEALRASGKLKMAAALTSLQSAAARLNLLTGGS